MHKTADKSGFPVNKEELDLNHNSHPWAWGCDHPQKEKKGGGSLSNGLQCGVTVQLFERRMSTCIMMPLNGTIRHKTALWKLLEVSFRHYLNCHEILAHSVYDMQ